MSRHPLLVENENKRLTIRLPLLICFSLFTAWQMGAMYFSGQTLSIDGRTPLPVDIGNLTVLIAAGYILSIIFMIAFPHFIVWAERTAAGVALLAAMALFLPFSLEALALLYYVQCFCCLFMIGFETAVITNLFTEKTAILHLLVAYAFSGVVVAVMQNDIFRISFPVYRMFTVAALALMLIFFWRLPAKKEAWPHYVKKEDKLTAPKTFIAGILIMIGLDNFSVLFGVTIAESLKHGLFLLYMSSVAFALIVFLLWKRFGVTPLKSASVLLAITALGFVMAMAARFVPAISPFACVLLGAGVTCCYFNPLFGLLIVKRYPSKFIVPAIIGIAFSTVLVHTALLEALRNNLTVLYVIYLVIAVGMTILYLILEPYLLYSFRGRTLQDIIGVVAEEADAEIGALDPKAIPIAVSAIEQTPELEDTPLNDRRMQNLTRQSITPLTSREYQVADLIMQGMKRQEIADTLNIKPDTISKHRNAIYSKFGIHRRQELFAIADRLDSELAEEPENTD